MPSRVKFFLPAVVVLVVVIPRLWAQTSSPAEAQYPISQTELKNSLNDAEKLIHEGAWLEAKARYQTLIQYDLSEDDREAVRKALEVLNMKILFSPIPTPNSFFYEVQPGDSLYKIAQKYRTTIELIQKANYLSTDKIHAGMKLKISKATYSIMVDKSENRLRLYSDEELLKTYPIATGEEDKTPLGSFTIVNKLVDPVWYKTGVVVPAGSPDNILGSRWLGFSLPSYGIHGTTMPETIGTNVTAGCIRMYNHDVEEIYSIVPTGTQVTVVD